MSITNAYTYFSTVRLMEALLQPVEIYRNRCSSRSVSGKCPVRLFGITPDEGIGGSNPDIQHHLWSPHVYPPLAGPRGGMLRDRREYP